MNYTNFTIRLFDWNYGVFKAEVVNSPVGRMRTPDIVQYRAQIDPLLRKLEDPREYGALKDTEMHDLGNMLGEMLLPLTVRGMLQKSMAEIWSNETSQNSTQPGWSSTTSGS